MLHPRQSHLSYWPTWSPVPLAPWRLEDKYGRFYRPGKPLESGYWPCKTFETAHAAERYARRQGLRMWMDGE